MKKMDEKKLKEDSGFPYGWNKGRYLCDDHKQNEKKVPANIR